MRTVLDDQGRIRVLAHRVVNEAGLQLVLSFAEVDGRVEVVRLEVGPDLARPARRDPTPITSALLRRIDLARIASEGRSDYLRGIKALDAELRRGPPRRELALRRKAAQTSVRTGGRGRKRLSAEEVEEAAAIYRAAHRERRSPTKAVAEALRISYPAAVKRVARAREQGLLPPTTKGKARAGPGAAAKVTAVGSERSGAARKDRTSSR